ncbi:unnamed protein product [Prorocentrum cordatum]|uniref:Uncharacterized protein n=1 Tax=Prorocentrum cordatum TaxID=2364126 RepID=A0ABN9SJQ9_9DINO|nr:unnamed protein product [Polarella glacialis]
MLAGAGPWRVSRCVWLGSFSTYGEQARLRATQHSLAEALANGVREPVPRGAAFVLRPAGPNSTGTRRRRTLEGGRKEGGAEEGKMLALATPLGNPKRSRSGGCARWHCFNTGTRGLPGTAAAPTGDVASKSFRQHIGHNGARPCARSSTCKTLLLPTTPRASSSAREASLNLDADPRPVGLLVDGGFLLAPAALLALVAHV